jgi:hypothetical protein
MFFSEEERFSSNGILKDNCFVQTCSQTSQYLGPGSYSPEKSTSIEHSIKRKNRRVARKPPSSDLDASERILSPSSPSRRNAHGSSSSSFSSPYRKDRNESFVNGMIRDGLYVQKESIYSPSTQSSSPGPGSYFCAENSDPRTPWIKKSPRKSPSSRSSRNIALQEERERGGRSRNSRRAPSPLRSPVRRSRGEEERKEEEWKYDGPMSPRGCSPTLKSTPFDRLKGDVLFQSSSREYEDHLGPGSYSPLNTETTMLKKSFNVKADGRQRSKSAPRGGGRRK